MTDDSRKLTLDLKRMYHSNRLERGGTLHESEVDAVLNLILKHVDTVELPGVGRPLDNVLVQRDLDTGRVG